MAGWLNDVLDWMLPPRCAGCHRDGAWWCEDCDQRVSPIDFLFAAEGVDGIRAGAYYTEPLRSGLRALKYRHAKTVAPPLAAYLERPLAQIGDERLILVPVPLHRTRLKTRGHNQAELLARAVSRRTGIPITTRLVRDRATVSQTTLDKPHRAANVTGAFAWHGEPLTGRTAVIIDDVTTTGATLSACAAALKTANPAAIWGLTVAKKR